MTKAKGAQAESVEQDVDQKLLNQIMGASASRPKGKYMADGRYVIEITYHGYQKDRDGGEALVIDGRVVCTTADPDPLRATKFDDPCHFRHVKNDSFPGNVKAICEALELTPAEVVYGKALVGKQVRLTATTITTKAGKPFTQITIEGFADGSENFKPQPQQVRKPVNSAPDDEDIPF